MLTVGDIITLWPSPTVFAEDLGIKVTLVHVWRHRKFIPPEHWEAIEKAAVKRKISGATASHLASLAARRREGAAA